MAALALETPRAHHLQKNAEPVLQALDTAIEELQAARAAWSPTLDNRKAIDALSQKLVDLSSALLEVDGEDHELQIVEQLRKDYRTRLEVTLQEIRKFSRMIASDEEGIAPLHKRLTRVLADAETYVKALRTGNDARV